MAEDSKPTRVLIVEDSPVCRDLLVSVLQTVPGLQIVGTARNGVEGVRLAKRLAPDVIAMDVHMPEMDGIEATRQIMIETPRPIVIISASLSKTERNISFDALQAGALTVLEKPTINDSIEVYNNLARQLKLMSEVKVVRRWQAGRPTLPPQPVASVDTGALRRNGTTKIKLVVIASSTGGPGVLAEILRGLPANFPVPILIVQHITVGFGEGLAAWLNQQTVLNVRLAKHADEPKAGEVLIAPDDSHMSINSMGLIHLNNAPPIHGLRPAADVLFTSVAQVYGATAIGVVLTGMGSDGAEGLRLMRKTGAHTIAQDKASCVVFGMPAVAIELGAAEQVLPASKISQALMLLIGHHQE